MIITYDEDNGVVSLRKTSIKEEPYDSINIEDLVEIWQKGTADTPQMEEHQELEAYRKCIKSRSFWDAKHCDGCHFYDDCPFNEREDAPRTYCDTCKHDLWNNPEVCVKCVGSTTFGRKPRMYEPKDEPQTERYCTNCKHNGVIEDYECRTCNSMNHHEFIQPQTNCAWK